MTMKQKTSCPPADHACVQSEKIGELSALQNSSQKTIELVAQKLEVVIKTINEKDLVRVKSNGKISTAIIQIRSILKGMKDAEQKREEAAKAYNNAVTVLNNSVKTLVGQVTSVQTEQQAQTKRFIRQERLNYFVYAFILICMFIISNWSFFGSVVKALEPKEKKPDKGTGSVVNEKVIVTSYTDQNPIAFTGERDL